MEDKKYIQKNKDNAMFVESAPVVTTDEVSVSKKSRGCFFRGCIGCSSFALLVVLGIFLWWWFAWQRISDLAIGWTSIEPLEMREIVPLVDDSDRAALSQRRDILNKAILSGGIGTYVIDQDMIDFSLLTQEDQQIFDMLLGDDDIAISLCVPLSGFNISKLQQRYFNIQTRGTISYENGRLEVYLWDIDIPGKELPWVIIDELINKDLWPYFYREENVIQFIQKFESIHIVDWEIVLEMSK